jgi:flagellar assembly protein FliH
MLCKLYGREEVEVREAPWKRRGPTSPSEGMIRRRSARGGSESAQLLDRIDELNAEMVRRSKEGYDQGFKAGEAAMRKSLEDQTKNSVGNLARTVTEVATTRAGIMRRAEADTVRLSIEIARRVLHREVSINPTALGDLVRAALDKLKAQEVYRVRIHPSQEKLLQSCLEQAGRATVEIVADNSRPVGGALFEVSRGSLDASVETQLREIENGLTDEMERRA